MSRGEFHLENQLEKACCKLLRQAGLDPRKQNVIQYRGRFDRLVLGPHGFCMHVEFKLPGFELTPLQLVEQQKLETMAQPNCVVHSLAELQTLVIDEYRFGCWQRTST